MLPTGGITKAVRENDFFVELHLSCRCCQLPSIERMNPLARRLGPRLVSKTAGEPLAEILDLSWGTLRT
jgi:hypothetical protein